MCGLLGVFDRDRLRAHAPWSPAERQDFGLNLDRLEHRGPDGRGIWEAPGLLVGHRRLAILDLSERGAQPMVSNDGTVLAFNGEIYNYQELRTKLTSEGAKFHSTGDTEVLLASLDKWGLRATLERLRGMFAFVAWRPREQQLWLARDPVGKKPLVYANHGNCMVFGSSVEAVLACLVQRGFRPEIDPVAVSHALGVGYTPAPRTGVSGVEKLAAGSYLVVSARDVDTRQSRFWQVSFPPKRTHLSSEWSDIQGLFEQAVVRRLRSDVPVAAFLSGGLDSSLVVAAASRHNPRLVTYTARTDNGNDDEFALAVKIARHLRVQHRVIDIAPHLLAGLDDLVRQYGEAYCDSSALPTAAICRAAGASFRVMLTGDGGDEVQGGYPSAAFFALRALVWGGDVLSHEPCSIRQRLARLLENDRRRLAGSFPKWRFRLLRLLSTPIDALRFRHDGLDQSLTLLRESAQRSVDNAAWSRWALQRIAELGAPTGLDAQLGYDFSVYLADDLNPKVDVASMSASVEARAPLLDQDFVEACWRLRTSDRVRPWARKRVVAKLAGTYLPRELLIRRKQGFSIPVARWLASSGAGEQLEADLRSGSTGLESVVDTRAVLKVLADSQVSGHELTELRWRLLVLSRWARWMTAMSTEAHV